jgi:hypothetical protein
MHNSLSLESKTACIYCDNLSTEPKTAYIYCDNLSLESKTICIYCNDLSTEPKTTASIVTTFRTSRTSLLLRCVNLVGCMNAFYHRYKRLRIKKRSP